MRLRLLPAVALAAGLVLPAASAAAVAPKAVSDPGSIGIRLLDAPAAAAKDPRARIYIVDHLAPGAVIHRHVEVSNTTDATKRVSLYPGAADVGDASFLPADGRTPSEVTGWTTVKPSSVSLGAGKHAAVEVTIKIPKDASPGERYGVVWAQNAGAAPTGGGVGLVNRVGVRLYLSIGGGNAPASAFTVDGLAAQRTGDGSKVVVAQVHNTGGRALDLNGTLKLTKGPGGLRAGPFPVEQGVTLAPGNSAQVKVLLDREIPNGPWQAELTMTSGLLKETTKATLLFPSSTGSIPATGAQNGWFTWWIGALGVVAIGVGWFLLLLLRRRHRKDDEEAEVPTPPVPLPV